MVRERAAERAQQIEEVKVERDEDIANQPVVNDPLAKQPEGDDAEHKAEPDLYLVHELDKQFNAMESLLRPLSNKSTAYQVHVRGGWTVDVAAQARDKRIGV